MEDKLKSSETPPGQIILKLLEEHPEKNKILDGRDQEDFIEERVDLYFTELDARVDEGQQYHQAKELATAILLEGLL